MNYCPSIRILSCLECTHQFWPCRVWHVPPLHINGLAYLAFPRPSPLACAASFSFSTSLTIAHFSRKSTLHYKKTTFLLLFLQKRVTSWKTSRVFQKHLTFAIKRLLEDEISLNVTDNRAIKFREQVNVT